MDKKSTTPSKVVIVPRPPVSNPKVIESDGSPVVKSESAEPEEPATAKPEETPQNQSGTKDTCCCAKD